MCKLPIRYVSILISLVLIFAMGAHAQQQDRQLVQTASPTASNKRIALVIGNGAYTNAPPLKNPPNDAKDMADALSKLGFSVEHGVDLNQRLMKNMIRQFGQKLKGGAVGLFYFAGHGVQLKGQNYLIPVDAEIQSEADVEDLAVNVNLLLNLMDQASNGLNIVILDACRNNPFARSFRSAEQGLAQVDAPTGTLISYATAPGRVAADGTGRNGLYTAELLKQMRVPGLSVTDMFQEVRAQVVQQTGGKQVPWEASSLVGRFYFSGAANTATGVRRDAPQPNATAIELAYWDTIKNSTDPNEYRTYLNKYPNGEFVEIARTRINNLETAARQAAERERTKREERDGQAIVDPLAELGQQISSILVGDGPLQKGLGDSKREETVDYFRLSGCTVNMQITSSTYDSNNNKISTNVNTTTFKLGDLDPGKMDLKNPGEPFPNWAFILSVVDNKKLVHDDNTQYGSSSRPGLWVFASTAVNRNKLVDLFTQAINICRTRR